MKLTPDPLHVSMEFLCLTTIYKTLPASIFVKFKATNPALLNTPFDPSSISYGGVFFLNNTVTVSLEFEEGGGLGVIASKEAVRFNAMLEQELFSLLGSCPNCIATGEPLNNGPEVIPDGFVYL